MIGELVGAGVSLLGGLFGKKKEKTVTESTVDYQKMAANAAAAGFNPLTAIRNGGSAGFTTSTTTSPTTSQLPGALQSIGGALGDALSNQLDPVAKKQRQLDTALVDYQLRQLKEGPKASGTLYPGAQFIGTKVSNSKPTMTGGKKGFIGPEMPQHLKLDKPMPMYVTVIDDNGKRHRFPNPELPDLDQMLTPSFGVVQSEGRSAWNAAPGGFAGWMYGMRERMGRMGQRHVVKPLPRKGGGGGW